MKRLTLTGLLLFAALLLSAQPLQLAHVFSDHAVLQRETAAPVWGWGEPGKTVTVTASWTPEAVKAKVAADGSWRVTLPTGAAGGPYTLTVINNLVYAAKVGASHPEQVNSIVKKELWLSSDKVSAYLLNQNGRASDIIDPDLGEIKAELIDGVSNVINQQYDQLLQFDDSDGSTEN